MSKLQPVENFLNQFAPLLVFVGCIVMGTYFMSALTALPQSPAECTDQPCEVECGGECEEEMFQCKPTGTVDGRPYVPLPGEVFTQSPGRVYNDDYEMHKADDRLFAMTQLELSIWLQGSSGKEGPIIGDGGLSRGPLQCSVAAWKDALEFDPSIGGEYEDVDNIEYVLAIFRAYTNRYAISRRIGDMNPNEAKARIWNGGPTGHRKSATLHYWEQVKSRL